MSDTGQAVQDSRDGVGLLTVFEHLEECKGGNVNLLRGVEQRRVRRWLPHPRGAEYPLQAIHADALWRDQQASQLLAIAFLVRLFLWIGCFLSTNKRKNQLKISVKENIFMRLDERRNGVNQ